MRAAVVRKAGRPDSVEIIGTATPEPGSGQVRIRVQAAALNPIDAFVRSGVEGTPLWADQPQWGLGWDAAGTIDAVGADVDGFTVGDAVIAIHTDLHQPLGAQAEFLVADVDAVTLAPEALGGQSVSAVEAATIPLNGLTAWQALDLLEVEAGTVLVVTGAAGAVGGYAVRLATERGARVIAVASEDDGDVVRAFGATDLVARGGGLTERIRRLVPEGVDAVLDAAPTGEIDAIRDRGRFITTMPFSEPESTRIHTGHVEVQANQAQLAELSRLAASGTLELRIADTVGFDELNKAYERLNAGGVRGRLVLEL